MKILYKFRVNETNQNSKNGNGTEDWKGAVRNITAGLRRMFSGCKEENTAVAGYGEAF